jgi:hypothetical protein
MHASRLKIKLAELTPRLRSWIEVIAIVVALILGVVELMKLIF